MNSLLSILFLLLASASLWGQGVFDRRFGVPGTSMNVQAVAEQGRVLYVGGPASGLFRAQAGQTSINGIAAWDGTNWNSMGGGIVGFGEVKTIFPAGQFVYVGGIFTNMGGVSCNHLAKWDGTAWSAVPGLEGTEAVHDIQYASAFYISGSLGFPGDTKRYALARMEGTAWNHFGSVLFDSATTTSEDFAGTILLSVNQTLNDQTLYLGGQFSSIGGVAATNVAFLNSQRNWASPGGGLMGRVHQLKRYRDYVYAVGDFPGQLRRYEGNAWRGFQTLTPEQENRISLRSLATASSYLYVGGTFTNWLGTNANNIIRYDGTNWSTLGSGIHKGQALVQTLATSPNNDLLVGGHFLAAGTTGVSHVARWSNNQWLPIYGKSSLGGSAVIDQLIKTENGLIALGDFETVGNVASGRMAFWNGRQWSGFGEGFKRGYLLTNRPRSAVTLNGETIVVGNLTNISQVTITNAARWNGTSWSSMGVLDSQVQAVVAHNQQLFAATSKITTNTFYQDPDEIAPRPNQILNFVKRWDGNNWVDFGKYLDGPIFALASYQGQLVAAGSFSNSLSTALPGVARWTGSAWESMGTGLAGGPVTELVVDGDDLYAAGKFNQAGSIAVRNIARWNGTSWIALGTVEKNGVNGEVRSISSDQGLVFVAGNFTEAGDLPVNQAAIWDGDRWHPLPVPVSHSQGPALIHSVAAMDGVLYLAGSFDMGNGHVSSHFARLVYGPQVRLSNFYRAGGGASGTTFKFTAQGLLGLPFSVEATRDFQSWSPRVSNYLDDSDEIEVSVVWPWDEGFFRVKLEP